MTTCTTLGCENEATLTGVYDDGHRRVTEVNYCVPCADALGALFVAQGPAEEDFTNLVTNITLGRIYDILLLLLKQFDPALAAQIAEVHKQGRLVGPLPAYAPPEDDNGTD